MASSADTKIKTILTADSGDFEAGVKRAAAALQQAEGKFKQSSRGMSNALDSTSSSLEKMAKNFGIALGVGQVISFGRAVLEVADHLQTIQDRTGVAASTLRQYQGDIENAGGSLDDLGTAIQKMQIKLGQAEGGGKAAANAFKAIGLSVSDLKDLDPGEQFNKVATAISEIEDPTQRAAAAFTVFGKGAAPLLPFLDDFAARSQETAGFVDQLTASMSGDTIATLDDFGDAINTLSIRLTNIAATGLSNIINTMKTLKLQIAQISIQAQKSAGLIDPEVADSALADVGQKIDGAFTPTKDPTRAKNRPRSGTFTSTDKLGQGDAAAAKAQSQAERLSDAIEKLRDESQHALDTTGADEYSKAMSDIQFKADQLANTYNSKLTPAEQDMVDAAKAAAVAQIDLAKQAAINKQLGDDIGDAFSTAFEDAALGAKKLSDVVGDLGKAIEKALFNAVVTQPLNSFFGSVFSGGFSSLFGGGSAIGPTQTAGAGGFFGLAGGGNINAGQATLVGENGPELFKPRSQGQIIPNGAMGGGGNVSVTIVNNAGAKVDQKSSKNGNNTDIIIQLDQANAKNINDKGSATSQALKAQQTRTLIRR